MMGHTMEEKRKIKRLQSPKNGFQYILGPEVRKELNPIVFFDAGSSKRTDEGFSIGMHPHSGIGIITYVEGTDILHQDSASEGGIIKDGGAQWVNSGGGIWHSEGYSRPEGAPEEWEFTIHQLWFQLPPHLEEGQPEYNNAQPDDLPQVGNVKVIAGEYNGVTSPLNIPINVTYLDVQLKAGENFELATPNGQNRGFVFPRRGKLSLHSEDVPLYHLSILEENTGSLLLQAQEDTAFVLIMAEAQDVDTITQYGSIHTNIDALERSAQRILERKP